MQLMNIEKIGPYQLQIPKHITYTKFSCEDYYGISFSDSKIDVLDNKFLGTRLNINGNDFGEFRDIPFHEGTFDLLPADIKCQK